MPVIPTRIFTAAALAIGTAAIAGIVHIGAIFAYPNRAEADAFARIAALAPVNVKTALPPPDRGQVPNLDAAMATAVCRYDLSSGPFHVTVAGLDDGFLSFGMHSRRGIPYYGLNLHAGDGGALDLVLSTSAGPPASGEDTGATDGQRALQIAAPDPQGFVVIQAPVDGADRGRAALARVSCGSTPAPPKNPG